MCPDLFDRVYGCLAASQIASSMGAVCEGLSVADIEARHGRVDRLLPLRNTAHYKKLERPPGTTEDGVERQRFMCLAIRDKRGRITSQDLADAWVRYGDPDNMRVSMGWWDVDLHRFAVAGVPAGELGRFLPWHDIVSFARSCQPIGIINACDPRQAAADAMEVARLYTYPTLYTYGPEWAAAVAAAIAEAMSPEATVESVLAAATAYVSGPVRREIEDGVSLAGQFDDVYAMRAAFNDRYCAEGFCCAMSMCPEVVTKGLAIFHVTRGNVVESILGGVNFGRDTDCTAAVTAGISGAFDGARSIPREWIETVDSATGQNEYTVTRMTLHETAQMLYEALMSEAGRLGERVRLLRPSEA